MSDSNSSGGGPHLRTIIVVALAIGAGIWFALKLASGQ